MIRLKSIYDDPSADDGLRVLVERSWPRGANRNRTLLHVWMRDVAPSAELSSGLYNHQVGWDEFVTRYHRELASKGEFVKELAARGTNGRLTLVHGSSNERFNTAAALKMYLENEGMRL